MLGPLAGVSIAAFHIREAGTDAAGDSQRIRLGRHVERVQLHPPFSTNSKVSRIFSEQSLSHKAREGTESPGYVGRAVLVPTDARAPFRFCKL